MCQQKRGVNMSSIHVTNVKDASGNAALVTESGGVKTDKLTGITSAGSISVTSSGGNVTHNLSSSLITARGTGAANGTSFSGGMNVASLTDTGTGKQRFTFTSAHSATPSTVAAGQSVGANLTFTGSATTFCDIFSFNQSAYADMALTFICNGDLA